MRMTGVRQAARSKEIKGLGRLGFAARATIYLLIGWFALLLGFGHRPPEADQRGAMQEVAQHTGGFLLLLALTIGLAGYAVWRWSEAAFGVVGQGKSAGPRLQSVGRGAVYAALAVNGVNVLVNSRTQSQAQQQQLLTARIMQHPAGRWAVGIAGAVVIVIGLVLVVEGVMRRFKKYFKLDEMPLLARRIVWVLGTIGTTARGLVFALTGFFVVKAAWDYNSQDARGLDGALRHLADSDHGRLWVGFVAAGLIAFGLYGYCEALWRRT
ncbi:MAG: hypothetical protein QOK10_1990 [Pseudonocardiales bacterium]|jgi:hypothetical protein|nr:hypothetical protein [Pseudonocardiales bacterium]